LAIQSDPSGLSSASWAPYNKRTMEAGLWGVWAFRPDAEMNKSRIINVIN